MTVCQHDAEANLSEKIDGVKFQSHEYEPPVDLGIAVPQTHVELTKSLQTFGFWGLFTVCRMLDETRSGHASHVCIFPRCMRL